MTGSLAHDQADALRAAVREGLRGAHGTPITMSASARDALLRTVGALENSPDVVVLPANEFLTTSQAAEILGVSRMTVSRLIDHGELEAERPGSSHRRIAATDLAAYMERRRSARHKAVHALTEDITADLPPDFPVITR